MSLINSVDEWSIAAPVEPGKHDDVIQYVNEIVIALKLHFAGDAEGLQRVTPQVLAEWDKHRRTLQQCRGEHRKTYLY